MGQYTDKVMEYMEIMETLFSAGWTKKAQRVWAVRHARQRLGMVPRLSRRGLLPAVTHK